MTTPVFKQFSNYFFAFVKIQLNLLLEEYFLFSLLVCNRNMLLFYSYNLSYK